jgi:hypothetical protein
MQLTPPSRSARVEPLPDRVRWLAVPALLLLAGCGARQFEAQSVIPTPLVTRIPVVVGVHMPAAFREAVHREKHDGVEYVIAIGAAQSSGFGRLLDAMFTRVVPLASIDVAAATDAQLRGVFVPALEEFSFVTPRDVGEPMYAVSLKYRIDAYTPAGVAVDSWTFTGYGAQPSGSMPGQGQQALQQAVNLALRDAGAKIAVEFREQAIVRGLIDDTASPGGTEVQAPP